MRAECPEVLAQLAHEPTRGIGHEPVDDPREPEAHEVVGLHALAIVASS